jgi:hypothetical protein
MCFLNGGTQLFNRCLLLSQVQFVRVLRLSSFLFLFLAVLVGSRLFATVSNMSFTITFVFSNLHVESSLIVVSSNSLS